MSKRQGRRNTNRSGAERGDAAAEPSEQPLHPFERRLRAVVGAVDVARTLTTPLILSIKNLLAVAASSFNCDEASVIVRDDRDASLRFLCATGQVAPQLMQIRIPQGKGIAGFVFETGQPMAVADAASESSFYAEIDEATGYSTHTLLAMPLIHDGRTIGVLEFVNRLDGPPFEPFSGDEMDRAAHFASVLAPLVAAHQRTDLIESLFEHAMQQALAAETKAGETEAYTEDEAQGEREETDLRRWLDELRAAPEHKELLRLAFLLREIASGGDAERRMCLGVMESLAAFVKQGARAYDDRDLFS